MTQPNYIQDFLRRTGDLTYVPETPSFTPLHGEMVGERWNFSPNNQPDPKSDDFRRRAQLQTDRVVPKLEEVGSKAFTLFANVNDPALRTDYERNQVFPTLQSQQNLLKKQTLANNEIGKRLDELDEKINQASTLSPVKPFGWESPERAEQEIYYQASVDPEMKTILQYEVLYDVNEEFGNVFGEIENHREYAVAERRKNVEDQTRKAASVVGNVINPKLTNIPKYLAKGAWAVTPDPAQQALQSGYQMIPESARSTMEGFGTELTKGGLDFGLLEKAGMPVLGEQLEWDRPLSLLLGGLGVKAMGTGVSKVLGLVGKSGSKASPILNMITNKLAQKMGRPVSEVSRRLKHKVYPQYSYKGTQLIDRYEKFTKAGQFLAPPIAKTGQVVKGLGKSISKPPEAFTTRQQAGFALDMPLSFSAMEGLKEGGAPEWAQVLGGIGVGTAASGLLDTPAKWLAQKTGQGITRPTKALVSTPAQLAKAVQARGIPKPIDVYAQQPANPKNLNKANPVTPSKETGELGNNKLILEAEKLAEENIRRSASGLPPLTEPTDFNLGTTFKPLGNAVAKKIHDETFAIRRMQKAFRENFKAIHGRFPTPEEFSKPAADIASLNGSDARVKYLVDNMMEQVQQKLPKMNKNAQLQILDHYAKVLKAMDVIKSTPKGYRRTDAGKLFAHYLKEPEELILRNSKKDTGLYFRKLEQVLDVIEEGLGAKDFAKLDDGFKFIRAELVRMNDRLVKSGLMSEDLNNLFKDRFQNYTPTRWVRDTIETNENVLTKSQKIVEKYNSTVGGEKLNQELANELSKDATGLDLYGSLNLTLSDADKAIKKNELNKTLVSMILDDTTMTGIAKGADKTLKEYRQDVTQQFFTRRVISSEEEKLLKTSVKNLARSPKMANKADNLYKEILELEQKGIPVIFEQPLKKQNTIDVWNKGYRSVYEVNPSIAREIKELGIPLPLGTDNPVGAVTSALKHTFTAAVTQNPPFAGFQIGTDMMTAFARSEEVGVFVPVHLLNSFRKTLQKEATQAIPSAEKLPLAGKWLKKVKDTENIINDLYLLSGAHVQRWSTIDDVRQASRTIGKEYTWKNLKQYKVKFSKKTLIDIKKSGGNVIDGTSYTEADLLEKAASDVGLSISLKNQFDAKDTAEVVSLTKKLLKGLESGTKYQFTELPEYGEKVIRRMVFEKRIKKLAPNLIDDIRKGRTTLAEHIDNPIIADAAEAAVESTINFQRGGRWMKIANQHIPFLNVAFEGMKQIPRAFATAETGKTKKALIIAALSATNATHNVMNRITHPEYADIPERIRASGAFIIMHEPTEFYPDGRPKPNYTVVAPRNMEWAMLFGGVSAGVESWFESYREEMVADGAMDAGDSWEATMQAGKAFGQTFRHIGHFVIPYDVVSTMPLPIVSTVRGTNDKKNHFLNMPLIPVEKEHSPASEQYRATTENMYKDISKLGKVLPFVSESPVINEYALESSLPNFSKTVASYYDYIRDMVFGDNLEETFDEQTLIHLNEYRELTTAEEKKEYEGWLDNDELWDLKLALNFKDPSNLGSPLIYKYHPDLGFGVYSEVTEEAIRELGADIKENQSAEHEIKAIAWLYRGKMRSIAEQLAPNLFGVKEGISSITPREWVTKRLKIKDEKAGLEKQVAEKYPNSIVGMDKKDEYFNAISINETSKLMNSYYNIKPETEDGRVLDESTFEDYTDKEWTTFYRKRDEFIESLSEEDRKTLKKNIYARLEQGVEKEYKQHVESPAVKLYYGAFESSNIQSYINNGEIDLNEVMPYLSKLSKKQQTSVINKVFGIDTETTAVTGRVFKSTISPKVKDNKIQLADNPLLAKRLQIAVLAREWELNTTSKLTSTVFADELKEAQRKQAIITENDQLLQQMAQLGADEETAMSYVNDIGKIERNNKFLMRAGNEKLANGLVKWVGNQHLKIDTVLTQTGIAPNDLASISGRTLADIKKGVKASKIRLGYGAVINIPAGAERPEIIPLHTSSYDIWNKYYNK